MYGGGGDDIIDSDGGGALQQTLDGGAGNDSIWGSGSVFGGYGNDFLAANLSLNSTLDGGSGNDSLYANGNATMVLLGGIGNDVLKSTFVGWHVLDGGAGHDSLYGFDYHLNVDGGTNRYVLHSAPGSDDMIFNWNAGVAHGGVNQIVISAAEFASGLEAGQSAVLSKAATSAAPSFIYTAASGKLYFDADGVGAGARVLIATINTTDALHHPVLSAADIQIIA
jgi:Ca2+-binding RTX toxin-like protein